MNRAYPDFNQEAVILRKHNLMIAGHLPKAYTAQLIVNESGTMVYLVGISHKDRDITQVLFEENVGNPDQCTQTRGGSEPKA